MSIVQFGSISNALRQVLNKFLAIDALSYCDKMYICAPFIRKAGVVKLVDTLDLGSSAARCVGSSPSTRTVTQNNRALHGPDCF